MATAGDISDAPAGLVLTLELDGESFAFFNELRRRYYPPERNLVPAHVTMFYRLPGSHAREIKTLLRTEAEKLRPFPVVAGAAKTIERGVAFFLHAPQLLSVREKLAEEWWPWLTDRDKAGFRPHITIQNNVSDAEARATLRGIAALRPPQITAIGLHLWRYRNGPWEHATLFPFHG
jgi:hypothetical protein